MALSKEGHDEWEVDLPVADGTDSRSPWWVALHAPILFIFGLAGITYETLAEHSDRPYLLALFGGMIGLPFLTTVEGFARRISGLLRDVQQAQRDREPRDPPSTNAFRAYMVGWALLTFGMYAAGR